MESFSIRIVAEGLPRAQRVARGKIKKQDTDHNPGLLDLRRGENRKNSLNGQSHSKWRSHFD
jgi:hypothetical protein